MHGTCLESLDFSVYSLRMGSGPRGRIDQCQWIHWPRSSRNEMSSDIVNEALPIDCSGNPTLMCVILGFSLAVIGGRSWLRTRMIGYWLPMRSAMKGNVK